MNPFIIISLLILLIGCSTSQKEYDINHIVKLNGVYVKEINDEIVNGEVFQVVDDMKVPIGKMKNGKKDGLWTSWYENGQKESEETFKDGDYDGLWTKWHRNGQKKREGTWKGWNRIGLHTEWYENGQKKSEETYKDGKSIERTSWSYHENGKKSQEWTFKDGKEISEECWDDVGNECKCSNLGGGCRG